MMNKPFGRYLRRSFLCLIVAWALLLTMRGRGVTAASPPSSTAYANCRLGIGANSTITGHPTEMLNLGWYVNWHTSLHPVHPGGAEFMQIIRLQQTGSTSYKYKPSQDRVQQTVRANPGSIWLIGNEPDRRTYEDDVVPEVYAQAYHDLYNLLKTADPTARVAVGGFVQATPLRLKYLDMIRAAYYQRYGKNLPADLWNIHTFVLREEADSWGADLPSGINTAIGYEGTWSAVTDAGRTVHTSSAAGSRAVLSFEGDWASWTALTGPTGGSVQVSVDHQYKETVNTRATAVTPRTYAYDNLGNGRHALSLQVLGDGEVALDQFHAASLGTIAMDDNDPYPSMLYDVRDHDRLDLVQQQVIAFRQWMAANGERHKPLIISEYGAVFPTYIVDESGNSFSAERVSAFLTGSFDLFRQVRDPTIGLPADDNRLVQRWAWYSLDDPYFNGALFDSSTGQITAIGSAFRDYAAQIPPQADLLPLGISPSPALPPTPTMPITFTLHITAANAGNIATPITTTVRVWDGDPNAGGLLIGEAEVPAGLGGCGKTMSVTMTWPNVTTGAYRIYVELDPHNLIAESNESNNIISQTLVVGQYRRWFPLIIRS